MWMQLQISIKTSIKIKHLFLLELHNSLMLYQINQLKLLHISFPCTAYLSDLLEALVRTTIVG